MSEKCQCKLAIPRVIAFEVGDIHNVAFNLLINLSTYSAKELKQMFLNHNKTLEHHQKTDFYSWAIKTGHCRVPDSNEVEYILD